MAIRTASDASDGTVFGLGGLLPVAITVTATTMARDTSQPNRNAVPFRTPRLEGSTTRNAVSGSGSSATPTPIKSKFSTMGVLPPNLGGRRPALPSPRAGEVLPSAVSRAGRGPGA